MQTLAAVIIFKNRRKFSSLISPDIFDRFYRGDKNRSQTGIGLGLSQVKAFVEFLEDNVNVISTPNIGSIFTVSMPC